MKRFLLLLPQVSGLVAAIIAIAVLTGWIFNNSVLTTMGMGPLPMKASTAVCLLFAGASLILTERSGEKWTSPARWILSTAIFIAAAGSAGGYFPPALQMSEANAFSFLLISAALVVPRGPFGLVLTLAAAFFPGVAFVGYLYDVPSLYGAGHFQSIALHSAAGLILICAGILFSGNHQGLSGILLADSAGAKAARRFLPGAVLVPAVAGFVILLAQRAGWFPREFGIAFFAASVILAQMLFLVWSATSLSRAHGAVSAAAEDTRRRREELEASEARLRLTLNTISAATFDHDPSTRKTLWSDSFRTVFGRPAMSDPEEGLDAVHPEDRALLRAAAKEAARTGEVRVQCRILRAGEIRWVEAYGKAVEGLSGRRRYTGFVTDITDRKRAEDDLRQFRDIFLLANQAIGISRGSGEAVVQMVNPAYARLHGYTPEEMIGLPVANIYAAGERDRLKEILRVSDEAGQGVFETWHLRQDGSEFPVIIDIKAVKDDSGKLLYRIVTLTDITERQFNEERLRESAKLESIGVLAGGIAHDFNNILTGILGNASLLDDCLPADSEFRQFTRPVITSSERAAGLIRQMLAYSGRGRFVLERVNLSNKIRETTELIASSIPRSVELDLRLAPDLPEIEADPVQIQQVIMNLIINGAEACEGKPGRVTVTTLQKNLDAEFILACKTPFDIQPGLYVCLEVADDGGGIDPPNLAKIFDPFFTTKFTGRGLGLSAVLGIVRGHKGCLVVETEPGAGSTFRAFFPAAG